MKENLELLSSLSDEQFTEFFRSLPARTQLLVKSGMCDWREVLPQFDHLLTPYRPA